MNKNEFYFLIIFLVSVVIEYIASKRQGLKIHDPLDTITNIFLYIGGYYSNILFFGWNAFLLKSAYDLSVIKVPFNLYTGVPAFFLIDFLYYWYHRAVHNCKILWPFHIVHHSSRQLNLVTGSRLSWFIGLIYFFFFLPAAILGLNPFFVLEMLFLQGCFSSWQHTRVIGKLGFLEKIIITPSNHRVHHGSNDLYIGKNFGGVFVFWDVLFGTFQPETEDVKYGISTGFVSYNPFFLQIHGFIDYFKKRKEL